MYDSFWFIRRDGIFSGGNFASIFSITDYINLGRNANYANIGYSKEFRDKTNQFVLVAFAATELGVNFFYTFLIGLRHSRLIQMITSVALFRTANIPRMTNKIAWLEKERIRVEPNEG